MKKILISLVALFGAVTLASAADYNWAAGVKFGSSASGISVKKNMGGAALEGIASFYYNNALGVTGLYEIKSDLGSGFELYYGAGAHVVLGDEVFGAGIDGVVGVEYQIPGAPISFTFDYKPRISFSGAGTGFDPVDFGLGIRYCW